MKRVLIVENEPNIALALSFILEKEGFAVSHAGDGEKALAAARAELPNAILLDVMLPRKSGFEVLQELRGDPHCASIPVVVLTARAQPHDRRTARQAGANAYMTKPFSNREVVSEIRRLVPRD